MLNLNKNKQLPQNIVLEIQGNQDQKKVYFGWSGEASKPLPANAVFTHGKFDVLEMDPQVGLAAGLQDGQKINVEFCKNVPDCTTVSVEPLTEDDWEILELHAGYVEEHLLSQLRVVYSDQIICVWIHGKTLVRLVVAELDPKQDYLKLSNTAEVIVAPKVRKLKQEEEDLSTTVEKKVQPSIALRTCVGDIEGLQVHVHPDSMLALGGATERVRLTKLVPGFLRRSKTDHQEDVEDEIKAVFANVVLSTNVPLKHIAIGSVLRNSLEIKDFDIIK